MWRGWGERVVSRVSEGLAPRDLDNEEQTAGGSAQAGGTARGVSEETRRGPGWWRHGREGQEGGGAAPGTAV